ncbi:MAG: hypothetical protein L6R42_008658 [Xanthoria sp. 1 TBL-2021]|nr:MAG: hypothetical protein L6R42_008658 [Xanthoria sp. 1 TBL-2021]
MLHLARRRSFYPPETAGARSLANKEWMRNRLTVLLAHDALLAATSAMYRSTLLRTATGWLHTHPHERVDRLKLGGIHRAQPFSHEFDKGRYHEYMLADWALLLKEQQIEQYEYLRRRRVFLPDVVLTKGGDDCTNGEDGDDGAGNGYAGNGYAGDGYAGWMGDELGDANNLDYGIKDGWDGDYPDGYGDDPRGGIHGGGLADGLDIGFDGDDGGHRGGGDGGGGYGGGGDGGGGDGGGDYG